MKSIYRIYYSGDAFGDNLFSAYLTNTLIRNGFDAYLDNPKILDLIECPVFTNELHKNKEIKSFNCVRNNRTGLQTHLDFNVYTDLIYEFKKMFKIKTPIHIFLDHIPVQFKIINNVPSFDIVMITETGIWTPYRNWPYFDNLKKILDENSISYIDASKEKIRDNLLLNYVNNAKLFLGLETGASHYVSKVANGKTLIIQSGYTDFKYWAGVYKYEYLSYYVNCSPCWKREGCSHHNCMNKLEANQIFEKIKIILYNDL